MVGVDAEKKTSGERGPKRTATLKLSKGFFPHVCVGVGANLETEVGAV